MTATDARPFEDRIVAWLDSLDGDFVPAVEAARFVAEIRSIAPDELDAWLHERAEWFVNRTMGDLLRSRRSSALSRRDSRVFAGQAAEIALGTTTAGEVRTLRALMEVDYQIDGEKTRRRLGEMRYGDFAWQIEDYERTSRASKAEATWLRAIQRRLPCDGSQVVADLFTEGQLRSLRIQFTHDE